MAELTPGTTSKEMPALASASASSPPRPGVMDEQGVDGRLRKTVRPHALAREDAERLGRRLIEELWIDESIVDDDVRLSQPLERAHGEKPGVARAGAHQGHTPGFHAVTPSRSSKSALASSRLPWASSATSSPSSASRHTSPPG